MALELLNTKNWGWIVRKGYDGLVDGLQLQIHLAVAEVTARAIVFQDFSGVTVKKSRSIWKTIISPGRRLIKSSADAQTCRKGITKERSSLVKLLWVSRNSNSALHHFSERVLHLPQRYHMMNNLQVPNKPQIAWQSSKEMATMKGAPTFYL